MTILIVWLDFIYFHLITLSGLTELPTVAATTGVALSAGKVHHCILLTYITCSEGYIILYHISRWEGSPLYYIILSYITLWGGLPLYYIISSLYYTLGWFTIKLYYIKLYYTLGRFTIILYSIKFILPARKVHPGIIVRVDRLAEMDRIFQLLPGLGFS